MTIGGEISLDEMCYYDYSIEEYDANDENSSFSYLVKIRDDSGKIIANFHYESYNKEDRPDFTYLFGLIQSRVVWDYCEIRRDFN